MTRAAHSDSRAYHVAFAVPVLLIAAVLIVQYGFGLAPCEMCWWQRYPHFAAIPLAGAALALRGTQLAGMLVRLAALAILVSGLIGAFHAGVEYGWWQGPTACSSAGLGGDPLASIMNAPLIRCDVAPWTLLGVSLAGFNFLISAFSAAFVFALLGRSKQRTTP